MFNQKKKQIEELQLQIATMNGQLEILKNDLKIKEGIINDDASKIEHMNGQLGVLKNDLKTKEDIINDDASKIQHMNGQLEVLKNDLKTKEGIINDDASKIQHFESIVSNEQLKAETVIKVLAEKEAELARIEKSIEENRIKQSEEIKDGKVKLKEIRNKIVKNEDRQNIQSYGFYEPIFKDKCSDELKEKIKSIREEQKEMIRIENFFFCHTKWTVNSSLSKGAQLIKKMSKNYITSFNLMCDAIIDRVTVANIEKIKDKIVKTYSTINKQAEYYNMVFSQNYLDLKLQELDLMYSLAVKKEEEKEARRIQSQIIKEQKKVEKELEKQREKLEKELQHYQNQLENGDEHVADKIEEIKQQIEDNDYRKNNSLAGYVYIIENKSFGDGVYKIGVTRRLEPLDRIAELSNASVPFRFQPNCIIFSENAFQLENDLHKEFAEFRVNKVNSRKEYFKVSLEEIAKVVTLKYGIAAEFNFEPEHSEWLVSSQAPEINGVDDEDDED